MIFSQPIYLAKKSLGGIIRKTVERRKFSFQNFFLIYIVIKISKFFEHKVGFHCFCSVVA